MRASPTRDQAQLQRAATRFAHGSMDDYSHSPKLARTSSSLSTLGPHAASCTKSRASSPSAPTESFIRLEADLSDPSGEGVGSSRGDAREKETARGEAVDSSLMQNVISDVSDLGLVALAALLVCSPSLAPRTRGSSFTPKALSSRQKSRVLKAGDGGREPLRRASARFECSTLGDAALRELCCCQVKASS